MNLEDLKKPFKEDEIEWRLGQAWNKNGQIGGTCFAYVSARAIMDRLDEVCGPENWEVEYQFPFPTSVICKLSIRKPKQTGEEFEAVWVTKEDGAEQTDIESFKGGLSSALKRAGSAWGIGRYLYGLDVGFITVVQSGGYFGQLKDKTSFRWQPPKLPAWALPKPQTVTPEEQAIAKPITVTTTSAVAIKGYAISMGVNTERSGGATAGGQIKVIDHRIKNPNAVPTPKNTSRSTETPVRGRPGDEADQGMFGEL